MATRPGRTHRLLAVPLTRRHALPELVQLAKTAGASNTTTASSRPASASATSKAVPGSAGTATSPSLPPPSCLSPSYGRPTQKQQGSPEPLRRPTAPAIPTRHLARLLPTLPPTRTHLTKVLLSRCLMPDGDEAAHHDQFRRRVPRPVTRVLTSRPQGPTPSRRGDACTQRHPAQQTKAILSGSPETGRGRRAERLTFARNRQDEGRSRAVPSVTGMVSGP
jgi:hypothetical protein